MLLVARSGAETRVDGGRLEEFEAQVRPGVGAVVERGVHDGGVEVPRRPAVDGPAEFVRGVAVAAGDHNVEIAAVLAVVDGSGDSYRASPVHALNDFDGGRVGACLGGIDS